jgi:chaperonin GroES
VKTKTSYQDRIKPMQSRVVFKQDEAAETSPGGIILPEGAKEKPRQGTVVAVGPGEPREDGTIRPMSISIGDRILYAPYDSTEITVDGEKLLLTDEDKILAKIS